MLLIEVLTVLPRFTAADLNAAGLLVGSPLAEVTACESAPRSWVNAPTIGV